MIKAVIFDLDGTLVSTKDLHYESLNQALREISPGFIISREDHLKTYDGLPTNTKLKMLCERGLNSELVGPIAERKKQLTTEMLRVFDFGVDHSRLFKYLKKKGYKTAICTNAVRETLSIVVGRLGIAEYVDVLLSNEDVTYPKPNPEMYEKCFNMLGVQPQDSLIFEDSEYGILSAENSGAWVRIVEDDMNITVHRVRRVVEAINNIKPDVNLTKTFSGIGDLKIKSVCPKCGTTRFVYLINRSVRCFTGLCKTCNARKQHTGPRYSKSGYKYIQSFTLNEDDRILVQPMLNANSEVFEHRLVMAKFLGRPLYTNENIHHKNGIKDDNRIENLELWTTNQPTGQRVIDKIEWCKEFLKEYGDLCK